MSPSTAAPARTGKQKKKFAEDSGIAHLLSLSQSITDAKSQLHQTRIDTTKSKIQAQKLKKQQDAQRKKERSTTEASNQLKAKSKAEIKAGLKAQQREKAKLRKEKRKAESKIKEEGKAKDDKKPRKSVSFALA
ncbi:hypothetical protein EX895_005510 [Sporisorium graminicola]|uniref:Uncharacterized protein n=1 Tax=Sporisorium graminicola TaxID=280036 RepID=A0A4U7KQ91_9BASI|nr:hypothetical protein EX895_005510 [Sporisorium graminicola]TKY85348.1 hypothetical protein EX895_005510 [Sporisorium graminicola]